MVVVLLAWAGWGTYHQGLQGLIPGGLIILAFALIFGFLILRSIVDKEIIHITEDHVHYRRRGLSGWTEWEKPMSDFKGILIRFAKNRENTDSVYLYADDEHRIHVFEGDEYDARNVCQAFAEALGMPCLDKRS
jgi:hypothetical protein